MPCVARAAVQDKRAPSSCNKPKALPSGSSPPVYHQISGKPAKDSWGKSLKSSASCFGDRPVSELSHTCAHKEGFLLHQDRYPAAS